MTDPGRRPPTIVRFWGTRGTLPVAATAAGISIRLAAPNEVMREIIAISRYDRLFMVDDALPADRRSVS